MIAKSRTRFTANESSTVLKMHVIEVRQYLRESQQTVRTASYQYINSEINLTER